MTSELTALALTREAAASTALDRDETHVAMSPTQTIRVAADTARFYLDVPEPIRSHLGEMLATEADRLEAMERAREREIERRRSDGRDHAWLGSYAPTPDPHLYAIARHITGDA